MASVAEQRQLLAAMAQGGSAGVQAYERYRQQAKAADAEAYQSLLGELGDPSNPYYRDLVSSYTAPYRSDAASAADMWADTTRYVPLAATATASDYARRLNQARQQYAVDREIEEMQRNAAAAARQSTAAAGLSDLTLTEQEAIVRGHAEQMGEGLQAKLAKKAAGKFELMDELINRLAATPGIEQAQEQLDRLRSAASSEGASVGGPAVDRLEKLAGVAEHLDAARRKRDKLQAVVSQRVQMLDTPEALRQRALEVAQDLYDDPALARGLVEHWFDVELGDQERAVNEILWGNPEGELGAWAERQRIEDMRSEMATQQLAESEGVSETKFRYALNEAKLDVDDAVDLMSSEAWDDVREAYEQSLEAEASFGADPYEQSLERFIELLDELGLPPDKQAFAVSLYFD